MSLRVLTLIGAAVCLLPGCVTNSVTMDAPDGFASFGVDRDFRAMSPEGVVVRTRSVANEPAQTLSFWAELLERHLTDSGYLLIERSEFSTDDNTGVVLEWLAPVREDDWIFLTAIVVRDDTIAIVEAAGPTHLFEEYRNDIHQSLSSLAVAEK